MRIVPVLTMAGHVSGVGGRRHEYCPWSVRWLTPVTLLVARVRHHFGLAEPYLADLDATPASRQISILLS
jgi:uncharacterized protein related to proFAR isomerase